MPDKTYVGLGVHDEATGRIGVVERELPGERVLLTRIEPREGEPFHRTTSAAIPVERLVTYTLYDSLARMQAHLSEAVAASASAAAGGFAAAPAAPAVGT